MSLYCLCKINCFFLLEISLLIFSMGIFFSAAGAVPCRPPPHLYGTDGLPYPKESAIQEIYCEEIFLAKIVFFLQNKGDSSH